MTYLLDVNVLLALGYEDHSLHARAERWADRLQAGSPSPSFATCSITELGFVRIASGGAKLTADVRSARLDLNKLKAKRRLVFLTDRWGADRLPAWVQHSRQVTDGHLLQLAIDHDASLATMDERISGALLIPKYPDDDSSSVREPPTYYGVAA